MLNIKTVRQIFYLPIQAKTFIKTNIPKLNDMGRGSNSLTCQSKKYSNSMYLD